MDAAKGIASAMQTCISDEEEMQEKRLNEYDKNTRQEQAVTFKKIC